MNRGKAITARLLLAEIASIAIEKAGLSQREAAAKIGITPQYLSDILSGRRYFTPDTLDALHKATGATTNIADWLIVAVRARGWDI